MAEQTEGVKTYFVTIPAHKFLHIKNYESIGYWDFWQKQSLIPGQDCETICGLLDSIKGKLDDVGGDEPDSGSGQLMAFINEPTGRICSWGIPLAECYGVRLPVDYAGEVPPQMLMINVPEGEYIVFEHGPFDFEKENSIVEGKIEKAMSEFDYSAAGYCLDMTPGRIFYFYHDCKRFWKYIRPVRKLEEGMIRKFRSADTGQVMEIWLHGNEDAHSFIPKDYWKSNYLMVQEQLLQAEVYVYEAGGTVQGFVGMQENYLAGIFVKKEVRSTGIGKQLLDYVKAIHPTLTLNVYQKNRRAVEFYKREGFSVTLEDIDPDTGEPDYTMCIVK